MADGDVSPERVNERVLDALVSSTEATTHLNATVSSLQQDYTEARKQARERTSTFAAKLDNLDRSVSEMKLIAEKGESARQAELKRIYDLLGEERKDRREAVTEGREGERDARTSERDWVREIIREEVGDRRTVRDQNKNLMVSAGEAIWDKGGQWVVAALALLVLAAVMKLTGLSLAEILGFARK